MPTYGNVGDIAIALASESLIRENTKKGELIIINDSISVITARLIRWFVSSTDCIIFQGGGNMGSIYTGIESERESVFSQFSNIQMLKLQFPSSINFKELRKKELARVQSIYSDVEIFAREYVSFEKAKEMKLGKLHLSPDIVFFLADSTCRQDSRSNVAAEKIFKKVLIIRRNDEERLENSAFDEIIKTIKSDNNLTVGFTDTVIELPSLSVRTDKKRKKIFQDKISEINKADIVLTDRLHGMILSLISGVPVVAFDNSTHKIQSTCKHWLSEYSNVYLHESEQSISLSKLKVWYSQTNGYPPNLKESFADLQELVNDRTESYEAK